VRGYLKLKGVDYTREDTNTWGKAWKDHKQALYAMTGWTTKQYTLGAQSRKAQIALLRKHLRDGDSATVGGTGHAYAIISITSSGTVKIYNPWGEDGNGCSNTALDDYDDGKNDGYMTISWSTLRAAFRQFTIADG
jgi:hypothetical protein